MKIFNLKYFALTFVLMLLVSCTSFENSFQEDVDNSANNYDEIFKMYDTFKLNGKIITDKIEIKKILSNPMEVAHYLPENKEVDFYTSEKEYRKVHPKSLEKELDDELVNATTGRYSADLGQFNSSYQGVSGLGDVFDQQYYRDFSKNSFITIYPAKSFSTIAGCWFYRLGTDSSLLDNSEIFKVNSATSVSTPLVQPAELYRQINLGNYIGVIKNDTTSKYEYTFYELENKLGNKVVITINSNGYLKIPVGKFNTLGVNKTPNSITLVATIL